MLALFRGDGVGAGVIVGHVGKLDRSPGLTIVGAPACREPCVARAANDLESAVGMLEDARLDGIDVLKLFLVVGQVCRIRRKGSGAAPCLAVVVAKLYPGLPALSLA